tara:strand:+ start:133 stop:1353 length:1221 start_codon:yes stop_codon:yes gene_type:complete
MALPAIRVRIGFNQEVLELDDLVRGKLDFNKLAGATVFTDVTNKTLSVSTSRGRSRDLDAFTTGTAQISLDNLDATFDPTNASGAYFGGIEPLMAVIIDATTDSGSTYKPIFSGFVNTWLVNYPNSADSTVTVTCADAFMKLANTQLNSQSISSAKTGAFITSILDNASVAFSPDRDIETGNSTMASQTLSENTLSAIQTAEFSEQGAVFIAKNGDFTFKQRHSTFPSTISATFSDDGSDLPYNRMDQILGNDFLYNNVRLKREGGSEQTVSNAGSQSKYLIRTFSRQDLYNNTDADVLDTANLILAKYAEVDPRFSDVEVDLENLSTSQQNTVLDLECIDTVKVEITPVGTSTQVSRFSIIDGVQWNITPTSQKIVFLTSDSSDAQFLILDSSTFGKLDDAKLGY